MCRQQSATDAPYSDDSDADTFAAGFSPEPDQNADGGSIYEMYVSPTARARLLESGMGSEEAEVIQEAKSGYERWGWGCSI